MQTLPRSQKKGPRCKRTVDIRPQAHQEVTLDVLLRFFVQPVSRAVILFVGWSFVAFLVHRARNVKTDNKVYDPYEILGISPVRARCNPPRDHGTHPFSQGATEKDIKSLFKKLSKI